MPPLLLLPFFLLCSPPPSPSWCSQDYDSSGGTTPDQIDFIDFTENTEAVCSKVNAQHASGGGDGPEDICGAFRQSFRLNWQAKAKFLILILDAPCHGRDFHSWSDR